MNKGSFKPTVMFFGLTNSPAMFQTMMNEIFHDLIMEGKVIVFINDILIFTKNGNRHDDIVEKVLKWLIKNDLYMKAQKCTFRVDTVDFLGLVITPDGIRIDKLKIEGVMEWPEPKAPRDV